jgi:hypothetical protein
MKCNHYGVKLVWSVQRLAAGWTVRGSNPGRSKRFYLQETVPTGSGIHQASCFSGYYSSCSRAKRPGCEVNHRPPTAEVKNRWNCTSVPFIRLHGVDRDSFTFTLPLPLVLSKLLSHNVDDFQAKRPRNIWWITDGMCCAGFEPDIRRLLGFFNYVLKIAIYSIQGKNNQFNLNEYMNQKL